MSSWSNLLQHAEPDHHLVHLYGRDDTSLIRGIAAYAAEGLRRQEPIVIVATRAHAERVRLQLGQDGVDAVARIREGTLRFVDAEELLHELVGDVGLQWEVFRDVVGALLGEMRMIRPAAHIRVFGEMVGLLWASERRSEAEQLEAYWNRLQETECFSLFCAYPVDLFDDVLEPNALAGLLGSHSHSCAGKSTLFTTIKERRQDIRATRL